MAFPGMPLAGIVLLTAALRTSRAVDSSEFPERAADPLSPVEKRTTPLEIEINFILEGFNDFRPIEMDFEMDLSINITWKLRKPVCERYEHELVNDGVNISADGALVIPPRRLTKSIYWLPDLFLVEAKSAEMSSDTIYTTNGKFKRLRDCSEATMIVLSKQKLVISCQLNLVTFPFDEHRCPLTIRSFSHGNETLRLAKSPKVPVLRLGNNRLQEFSFSADVTVIENDISWFEPRTAYSIVRIDLCFKRKMLNVILTAFFPSSAIVIVALLAYLMDVNSTYERVVLTMTTLLTQYSLITVVKSFLPPMSFMTRVDVFMYVCLLLNMVMVVECALIDKMNTDEKERLLTEPERIGFELDAKSSAPGNDGRGQRGKGHRRSFDSRPPDTELDPLRKSTIPLEPETSSTVPEQITLDPTLRQRLSGTFCGRKKNRVSPFPRLITPWSKPADPVLKRPRIRPATRNSVCAKQLFLNIKGARAERVDRVFKIVLLWTFLGFQLGFWAVHFNFMSGLRLFPEIIP